MVEKAYTVEYVIEIPGVIAVTANSEDEADDFARSRLELDYPEAINISIEGLYEQEKDGD